MYVNLKPVNGGYKILLGIDVMSRGQDKQSLSQAVLRVPGWALSLPAPPGSPVSTLPAGLEWPDSQAAGKVGELCGDRGMADGGSPDSRGSGGSAGGRSPHINNR